MSAGVETMFDTRRTPWHGLGENVKAGMDWQVIQKALVTHDGIPVPGFKANLRDSDHQVLGVVTDRYRVVQNQEAFAFTDALLGEGVTYETAGSLQNGRRTWILARLPRQYIITGDEITPYLVFMNSHDGSSSIKAAMTPIRVACQNTLNLALSTAKRSWSANHVGDIRGKLEDARETLLYAGEYMAGLGKAIEELNRKKLPDRQVHEYIDALFPLADGAAGIQKKNLLRMKEELKVRYFDAPGLQHGEGGIKGDQGWERKKDRTNGKSRETCQQAGNARKGTPGFFHGRRKGWKTGYRGIPLVDHIILGDGEYFSFREEAGKGGDGDAGS